MNTTRASLGTISFRSSNCFRLSSGPRVAGDEPVSNRISILPHDYRDSGCCFFSGTCCCRSARNNHVYVKAHEFKRKLSYTIQFSFCVAVLNEDVLSLRVSKFVQTPPECLDARGCGREGGGAEISDARDFRWLLRLSGKAR